MIIERFARYGTGLPENFAVTGTGCRA